MSARRMKAVVPEGGPELPFVARSGHLRFRKTVRIRSVSQNSETIKWRMHS